MTFDMIDFNADLAEGCPHDAELMQYVTSANIACATHAGSPATMMQALREAKKRSLRIGAHPGYLDRDHFGRLEQKISSEDLYEMVIYQLGALRALAEEVGVVVSYVKPHGAMYHQCGRETDLASALVKAAAKFKLAVMGQPGTHTEAQCQRAGVEYIREGFADRRYQTDGTLVPRTSPDAMIHDPGKAAIQIQRLIETMGVQSICVHGDEPEAVTFIRDVQEKLAWR